MNTVHADLLIFVIIFERQYTRSIFNVVLSTDSGSSMHSTHYERKKIKNLTVPQKNPSLSSVLAQKGRL